LNRWTPRPLLAAAAILIASLSIADEIRVEVGNTLAPGEIHDLTDAAVRRHARQTGALGRRTLAGWAATGRLGAPYTLPLRVVLTRNGDPLPMKGKLGVGNAINPVFDTTGPRVFPTAYRDMLEDVFTEAQSTMDVVFGQPAVSGDVHVRNYDADIQDRYAVAGGYYVPNGPDGPEIRFTVYNSAVSAAVNYVHCLLLAYQGQNPLPFEAWQEGFVRAATMRVVRTPGALPGPPDPAEVEQTLDSLYDVSAFYDWYNQPALGCERFIAPNLLNVPLPPGGSTGGVFLVRYLMAGTAWSKVATEHPAFFSTFNGQYYGSPGSYQTVGGLVQLGQQVVDVLAGGTGTIEGRSFEDWVERQYILDVETTAGMKVMVQPFPIDATAGTSDFGVFAIEANAFRTDEDGNESLLAGTAYPIYWRPDFVRFFASVQDDEIRFSGAYGSVVPNFGGAQFGGQQYRVAVDVPFAGANTRVVLPAGSYSTGTNPLVKNFFGTLTGLPVPVGGGYEVSIEWIGGSVTGIAVQNFAFGQRITDPSFNNAQPVTVRVLQNAVEVFSRRVNKGVGALALDLSPPESDVDYSIIVPARLDFLGVPLQPYRIRPTTAFETEDGATLYARWNPTLARFDLFPDVGQVMAGQGFYLRLPVPTAVAIWGYSPPRTPQSVSLLPGWNMVSVPFAQSLDTDHVSFTVATEVLSTFAEAQGTIIGNTVFEFLPDGLDPDGGTLVPATSFVAGKGYYVRALRPEGGVMVFTPTDFGANRPSGPTRQSGPTGENRWESRVAFTDPRGLTTYVELGQAQGALSGFDPRLDSELPPTTRGFQSAIVAERTMFKDVRPWGGEQTFRVDLTGLVPGARYELRLSPLVGRQGLSVYDAARRRTHRFSEGSGTVVFFAAATTQTFMVSKGGRS
jgi:hypothetical protein